MSDSKCLKCEHTKTGRKKVNEVGFKGTVIACLNCGHEVGTREPANTEFTTN